MLKLEVFFFSQICLWPLFDVMKYNVCRTFQEYGWMCCRLLSNWNTVATVANREKNPQQYSILGLKNNAVSAVLQGTLQCFVPLIRNTCSFSCKTSLLRMIYIRWVKTTEEIYLLVILITVLWLSYFQNLSILWCFSRIYR